MRFFRSLCCLIFVGLCSSISAAQESSNPDYLAPYFVNWSESTHQFSSCNAAKFNGGVIEAYNDSHFLLGDCPTPDRINLFYASTALIHYTAANLLPKRYSRALVDTTLNFQFAVFKEHTSMGVSVNF